MHDTNPTCQCLLSSKIYLVMQISCMKMKGLHCQVSIFEFVNAEIRSVYFPADLDLQNGRTIIKS